MSCIKLHERPSAIRLAIPRDEVNKETPLAPLRWSIAHLDNTSPQTLARMKALGVGWTMQDAMYLGGDRIVAQAGEAARSMPPIVTALRIGVHVGAGTDAASGRIL
ncbi:MULTISPECIES: hypothetical protein [unclassified Bradyrhizobium]|uniref:hypothetical protein n=1 Tax=unclassified Bradyrhizobium TaxID=2631580 RepID=UPI0004AD2AE0|nr:MULTISPECIES: hypothetical protein [unclassified Bradyrhizobium]